MHQALQVPEIFRLILEDIYDPKQAHSRNWGQPGYQGFHSWDRDTHTISSLARTCKSFSKPSLDVLWYYQSSLKPLLKCLPKHVLERRKNGEIILKLNLHQADFTRVDIYAPRIRILGDPLSVGPMHYRGEEVDVMIYPTIISKRSLWGLGPFLPNLIHLKLGLDTFCDLAWLPRLAIGSQLRFVNLIALTEDLEDLEYKIPWGNLLATLAPVLPHLETFTLSTPTYSTSRQEGDIYALHQNEASLEIVETTRATTELDIMPISLDAKSILHIANLQSLEILAICIADIDENDPLAQNLPTLPNLLELQVLANNPEFCSALVCQLGSKRLQTLKVIREDTTNHSWNLERFIGSLSTSRFVASINDIQVITPIFQVIPDPNVPPITHDTILQLSHFKNLRSIRLYLNGEVHLDKRSLRTVASVWPNLEVLDLRSRTRLGGTDPQVSLDSLLAICAKLPFLKEVRLRVDAQEQHAYASSTLPVSGIAASALETFDVCTAPISASVAEVVATLLRAAFPNLRELSWGWEWRDDTGVGPLDIELSLTEESSLKAWKKVNGMIFRRLY